MKKNVIFFLFFFLAYIPLCIGQSNAFIQSASPSLDEILKTLEKNMGTIETLSTDFIQEKKLAIFTFPILIKGKVFIETPDKLAWHVETPMKYSMIMEGKVMKQWDEETGKVQKISLKNNPAFETALSQMKDWFSGSYSKMKTDYNITLKSYTPITLLFVPKESSPAGGVIESVVVSFQKDEAYIKEIDINEKSGDKTLLKFENTDLNIPLDESAWELTRSVR